MKIILALISTLLSGIMLSQGSIGYIFEEMPNDSSNLRTNRTHSSLKPLTRCAAVDSASYLQVTGLADLNYMQLTQAKYKTGLGVDVTSLINDKWYIRAAGTGGLSTFDDQFRVKSYVTLSSDSLPYGYVDIRSRIGYTPNRVFNFQVGVDHNFIGEGSRSLLLSDYGRPYPFGLIRTNFWRIEYSVIYQFMRDQHLNKEYNKYISSHYLSFNAAPWLNFGIFESVIFQPKDSTLNRGFDPEYLNPVIFYRPQEYAIGSSDNALMGLDFCARWEEHSIYGQVILDEFSLEELRAKTGWWANKFGAQIGVKGRFKYSGNWFYRLEYNFVRPYTYAHISSRYNYGNLGYPVAHPYGANFMEILGELKYQKSRWSAGLFANYYLTADNKDGFNYGSDIYLSYVNRPYETGHYIGQGLQRNGIVAIVKGAYRVTDHGNMNLFVENQLRYDVQSNSTRYMLVVGLRSLLWNDHRNY